MEVFAICFKTEHAGFTFGGYISRVEVDEFGICDRQALAADKRTAMPLDHRTGVCPRHFAEITFEQKLVVVVGIVH